MPLICQPSQRGLEPGTCHTRSRRRKHVHTMDRPLSTKASQRNNAAYVHTVNVVLPEKPHSTHLVATGKGGEPNTSKDRSQIFDNPNAEISAVPDPVPNPLIPAVPSFTAVQTGRPFEMPKTVGDASSIVFSTRLVDVPNSLLSLSFSTSALSSTMSLTYTPPTSTSTHPVGTSNKGPPQQATPHQLSTTIITLLTLGGAFLIIAILIGVKLWIQPRRRSHPTPSLPILQDAFPQARKMGDESPLFGGKERLSSQTGNGGLPWAWTQYQSGIPKPVPAAKVSKSGETDQTPMRYSRLVDEPPSVTHARQADITGILGTGKPNTNYESSDGHPSKALSRLSTLSGLVHPGPMYEGPIGIAVGGLESSGAESAGRGVNKRGSTRNMEKRRSTIYGSPEGLAYTMSPRMPVVDGRGEDQGDGFLRQGRARVKAPYGAGSYFRGSASSNDEPNDEPNQKWVTPEVIGHHPVIEDKPPRVPSPPVLPSLAQIADYRSPTYSLYGLYSC
jgi:hypothetical protein